MYKKLLIILALEILFVLLWINYQFSLTVS